MDGSLARVIVCLSVVFGGGGGINNRFCLKGRRKAVKQMKSVFSLTLLLRYP